MVSIRNDLKTHTNFLNISIKIAFSPICYQKLKINANGPISGSVITLASLWRFLALISYTFHYHILGLHEV